MEQFNTIPTSGNWSDIAGILDANFLRCYTALVQSESLVGLSGSNFQGIYTSASTLPEMTSSGWALVGSSLSALTLYVYNTGSSEWGALNSTTYNFTDFSAFQTQLDALSSQLATIGSNLSDLSQRSNKFLRLAVMIDSTNGILSIAGKKYKLIPTTDTPTWDLDYNDFVTKSASDNPEFSYVLVDSENKILFGVYEDGTTIDNSSMVEGETIGGFDLISIINNYAATYNYD